MAECRAFTAWARCRPSYSAKRRATPPGTSAGPARRRTDGKIKFYWALRLDRHGCRDPILGMDFDFMAAEPLPTETSSALAFLADEDLFPLEVGAVAVDLPAGRLRRADLQKPIPFGFSFSGHAFEAQATQTNGTTVIDCAAMICRLPYTIEDRLRRAELSRVLTALAGSGLRWEISKAQVVRVGLRIRMNSTATANHIVAALVEQLLPVKGWLELLVEIARRPKSKPAARPMLAAVPAPTE